MKTFYSIQYNINGYQHTKWFDNLRKAKEFQCSQKMVDDIVIHNFKNSKKIAEAQDLCDFGSIRYWRGL